MTEILTMEFWIAVLFAVNFFIVVSLFFLVKKMNRFQFGRPEEPLSTEDQEKMEPLPASAANILSLLEPLVEEAGKTAARFDAQIREKRRLVKELNEALDSRIISINLLLSRADAQQRKLEDHHARIKACKPVQDNPAAAAPVRYTADDQQGRILSLYYQNTDIDTIARELSIPKGEVELVIDLKKKFAAMERNGK